MLVVFKAEGAADVMMFGEVAHAFMEIVGKEPSERGVITVEQLPEAIERLSSAIRRDKADPRPIEKAPAEPARDEEEDRPRVSLTQRALPLLALLEQARRDEVPVLWGV